MQTFLIVIGVLFAILLSAAIAIGVWLKVLAARGLLAFFKFGVAALKERAQAPYVGDDLRERVARLDKQTNDLPKPGLFSASRVLVRVKELSGELAEILQELDRLDAENAPKPDDNAIVIDAAVLPSAPLALPAPGQTDAANLAGDANRPDGVEPPQPGDHDAILAEFRAEWIKPDSGVIDAWLSPAAGEVFIEYRLSMEVATTMVLPAVPSVYKGLPTVITWFERSN